MSFSISLYHLSLFWLSFFSILSSTLSYLILSYHTFPFLPSSTYKFSSFSLQHLFHSVSLFLHVLFLLLLLISSEYFPSFSFHIISPFRQFYFILSHLIFFDFNLFNHTTSLSVCTIGYETFLNNSSTTITASHALQYMQYGKTFIQHYSLGKLNNQIIHFTSLH